MGQIGDHQKRQHKRDTPGQDCLIEFLQLYLVHIGDDKKANAERRCNLADHKVQNKHYPEVDKVKPQLLGNWEKHREHQCQNGAGFHHHAEQQ